jgi:hypothetical protein
VAIAEAGVMKRELGLLNVLCVVAAILFIVMAAVILLTSGQLLSTDNLFITMVCLVMALMFAVNPLLYLKSEGRLPIPFVKRLSAAEKQTPTRSVATPAAPPLLDAKGRPVPHDVRQIVANLAQPQAKDV